MVIIEQGSNPYVLDKVKTKNNMIALTRKNADFIEAVVRLDSNYGRDLDDKNNPSKEYDPESSVGSLSGKYHGSTAYWFHEMKQPNCDFKKCVLGAVIAIDITNTTHLEAAKSGRKTMRDIICDCCKNYSDLVNMLNKPFRAQDTKHLISLLTAKTFSIKDNKPRYNISFATKFCAYASMFLDAEVKYSKYDNVVSGALPKYEEIYLNRKKESKEYKIDYNKAKKFDDTKNRQYRLDMYEKYANTISDILCTLAKDKIILNKEEFDHIIWYSLK